MSTTSQMPAPTQNSAPRLRLAVIIVHYRTPALLRDCLATLLPQIDPTQDRIIVADNASGPEPIAILKSIQNITLLPLPRNLGFAGGNNAAISSVSADFYLLLNPDTLLRPQALQTLLDYLQSHPQIAMIGPRLEYPDATPQLSSFGDVTPITELIRGSNIGPLSRLLHRHQVYGPIPTNPTSPAWLAGACLLIRQTVLSSIGLLDDSFFMYFEEVDFCRRARLAGFQLLYLPAAHVVHLVGQSSNVTTDWQKRRLPPYWFESRHRYFRKHFGYLGALRADLFWLAGHTLMKIRKLFTGTSHSPCAQKETTDFLYHESRQLLHPSP